ncbi:hypothetical protein [Marinobacter xestospongiae]|uniref:Uncharacterized protein n=1 Tax=Marinobacter xestospongiae TaxID=994319 RepID=A0ABU3VYV5_9GAMM|nr:hypothetical protein [Marinobacter xestospongiae]MDV2079465.1 hypothetical protein [Marinobacter xestospongiae]
MGIQIQHILTPEDESELISYLRDKYSIQVANSIYPENWDRKTLVKSADARSWLVIDERVVDLVVGSSNQLPSGEWQIRSKGRSCIEWNRDLYNEGKTPSRGRLFVDAIPNDIYMDISSETGGDIEKQFKRAVAWLKKNCINVSQYKYGIWQSAKL